MLCSFFAVPTHATYRASRWFSSCLLFTTLVPFLHAQVPFRVLDHEVIEARLKGFSTKNSERESILERMFEQSGWLLVPKARASSCQQYAASFEVRPEV